MSEQDTEKRGLYLEWAWDIETAINCLVSIANDAPWRVYEQHRTDTRGIVTERAARAIRRALASENARLRKALTEIQTMTRKFAEANKIISSVSASKAFWRIAHVEKIAREALKGE